MQMHLPGAMSRNVEGIPSVMMAFYFVNNGCKHTTLWAKSRF